jgi:hypothetical protein
MEFFSALDVSMERTAICVVDDKGEVQIQTEVVTIQMQLRRPSIRSCRGCGAPVMKPDRCRPRCSLSSLSAACQRSVWRPSMCARRCRRSATRRMRRMRSA